MCFFTERDTSLSSGSEDDEEIEMVSETDSTMLERSPIPATSTAKRATREIMTPRLSAVLDKCKVSDRDGVHLLTACVEALSLNTKEYVINRTSIKKSAKNFVVTSDQLQKQFCDKFEFRYCSLGFQIVTGCYRK